MTSLLTAFILIIIVTLGGGYVISTYNYLIRLKNNVAKAWSNIDVLLNQRHDEIIKLVHSCSQYMNYEQATLKKVVEARQQAETARQNADMIAISKTDDVLHGALNALMALSENYPDLKANLSFLQLQERISQIENDIADRRELYNESVNINNTQIMQFPIYLVANLFRFKSFDLLQFPKELLVDINIESLFRMNSN